MLPASRRRLLATATCPVSVIAWAVLRVTFANTLPAPLIDRLMAVLLLLAGAVSTLAGGFRPAERQYLLPNGLFDVLAGLSLLWLRRPDKLWVLPAVLATCLWALSMATAVRAARSDSR